MNESVREVGISDLYLEIGRLQDLLSERSKENMRYFSQQTLLQIGLLDVLAFLRNEKSIDEVRIDEADHSLRTIFSQIITLKEEADALARLRGKRWVWKLLCFFKLVD